MHWLVSHLVGQLVSQSVSQLVSQLVNQSVGLKTFFGLTNAAKLSKKEIEAGFRVIFLYDTYLCIVCAFLSYLILGIEFKLKKYKLMERK